MPEENISPEIRSKNIDKIRDYFIEEISKNELMSKMHRKVCTALHYTEHLLILELLDIFQFILNTYLFWSYWIYFNFCLSFFSLYSYRNSEFCRSIKNLTNNCGN